MGGLGQSAAAARPMEEAELKPRYLESLTLVERLHRRLLDVVKDEFDRLEWKDINAVQALLLFNIGDSELTAGELRTRGYYLGSNVSYNLKKLVDMGYVHHQRSSVDRRAVQIKLTPKGHEVREVIDELYDRQLKAIEKVGGLGRGEFDAINTALQKLERFWTDHILYRL
ncbi:MAG: MarR family winged helix-turn-helix transcriptional regulator [Flavobacteriaceae bacterium]